MHLEMHLAKAPAWNQEEKKLPRLNQVLHIWLTGWICLIPPHPKRQNPF